MELPRGLQTKIVQKTKEEPKKIECPVVKQYERRTRFIPKPGNLPIKFNPNITLDEVRKFWILSALEYSKGSYTTAARMLGISRETVYRLVRELND